MKQSQGLGHQVFKGKNSQAGMTLISVLVAAAMIGIILAAALTIASNTMRVGANADANFDISSSLEIAKMQLADTKLCKLNFSGKIPTAAGLQITLPTGEAGPAGYGDLAMTTLGTIGVVAFPGAHRASLVSTSLKIIAGVTNLTDPTKSTVANLEFRIRKSEAAIGGEVIRTIPLMINVDAASKIVDCSSRADNLSTTGGTTATPAVGGSCDSTPLPQAFAASAGPPLASKKAAIVAACGALTYPTPPNGMFNCSTFEPLGGAPYPVFKILGNMISDCFNLNQIYIQNLTGLASSADCVKALAAAPNGSHLDLANPPGGLNGLGTASNSTAFLACVNGNWAEGVSTPIAQESIGNAGTGAGNGL